jgi:hypothetical protein
MIRTNRKTEKGDRKTETGDREREKGDRKTEKEDRGKSCKGLRSLEVYWLGKVFPEINYKAIYDQCP